MTPRNATAKPESAPFTRALRTCALPLAGVLAACSAGAISPGDPTASTEQAATSATTCATPLLVGQSLFVAPVLTTYDANGNATNTPNAFGVAALKDFSFKAVLEQIVTSAKVNVTGGAEPAALALYQQLLGTIGAPECTGTINGFPVDCPSESKGSTTNPFNGGANGMIPLAVVNRFDLAPNNGANCGEYRIAYAVKAPTFASHFLMNFEATLPNPTPSAGLAGCLPVAQFWESLSAPGITTASFASKLKTFFFDGLPGFAPVIQAQNYGFGFPSNVNTGQIRVNMQAIPANNLIGNWELRQFELSQECPDAGTNCTLTAVNSFVANNPFDGLFATVANGGSAAFQKELLTQVKPLAAATVPVISMSTPNADNGGISNEIGGANNYLLGATGNTSLTTALQTKLTALGSSLAPADILNRATTQSCAGCHQLMNGVSLGGGLTWPSSNGFTQVDDVQGPAQQSPALAQSFLPFRSSVLTSFLNKHCSTSSEVPADGDGDGTLTVGGEATGSAN